MCYHCERYCVVRSGFIGWNAGNADFCLWPAGTSGRSTVGSCPFLFAWIMEQFIVICSLFRKFFMILMFLLCFFVQHQYMCFLKRKHLLKSNPPHQAEATLSSEIAQPCWKPVFVDELRISTACRNRKRLQIEWPLMLIPWCRSSSSRGSRRR